jgi:ApaG protein
MFEATTRNIRVAVEPSFLDEQSDPHENRYLWAYRIVIENRGSETVQLLSRHWRITDGRGRLREVKGDGVVGEQPVLAPATRFEYTSGVPLETPSGFMTGSYHMRSAKGENFDVGIPTFALDSPYETGRVH